MVGTGVCLSINLVPSLREWISQSARSLLLLLESDAVGWTQFVVKYWSIGSSTYHTGDTRWVLLVLEEETLSGRSALSIASNGREDGRRAGNPQKRRMKCFLLLWELQLEGETLHGQPALSIASTVVAWADLVCSSIGPHLYLLFNQTPPQLSSSRSFQGGCFAFSNDIVIASLITTG